MIRKATEDDMYELVQLVIESIKEIRAGDFGSITIEPDFDSVVISLLDMIHNPDVDLSVVDIDGDIVGCCSVFLLRNPFNTQVIMAKESIWHMRPSLPRENKPRWFIKMLNHMIAWSKSRGAVAFVAGAQPNSPAAKLLDRRGIICRETYHVGGI